MDEPIVAVIHRYHPGWVAPEPNGRTWIRTCCPFHGDDRPSAAVSYELQSYKCLGCPAKGNVVTLISQQEGVSYSDAERAAADMALGDNAAVPAEPPRKPRSRLFGEPRANGPRGRKVRPRVRREPPPWT